MTKQIVKICVSLFLVFIFTDFSKPLFAQELSPAESKQVEQKIVLLETKLERLKSVQAQILEKQSGIIEELNALRIWIRRYRSG